jgi:putative ABC transport system permease protein
MFALFCVLLSLVLSSLVLGLLVADRARRSVALALRSLVLRKLRVFLSVLGIIIGTCSVIALMSVGEGSMQDALEDINRQGATNLIVRSIKPPDEGSTQRRTVVANYGLTYPDYERFLTIPTVIRSVRMRIFPQEVRRFERMHPGRVVATTSEYARVNKLAPAAGRFLTTDDGYRMLNVAVLGSAVARALFPYDDPVGQTVRLGTHFYQVVGILDERLPTGGSGGSETVEEFNDDVYIPLETCRVRFGDRIFLRQSRLRSGEAVQLSQVTLTVNETDAVRPASEVIQTLLDRHLKKDWMVIVPLDRLEEARRAKNRYEVLLVFIASISLVVGGIGIMNIMLATVTERTREIGIRRALGAKRRDIALQFVIEAVVQTTLGGLLGMILGVAFVYAIPPLGAWLANAHVPTKLHVPAIFLALAVSSSVGILFGWYPAQRAARLDPIEALRHE